MNQQHRSTGFDQESAIVVADFRDDSVIKSHPDYLTAKAGGVEAAARMIQILVTPVSLELARDKFGSDVVFVPVHAEEATGRNALPVALASYYAQNLNAALDTNVVQSNRAYHTGADAMERLIARSQFEGSVAPGKRYVLVDDVTTMGSTLADLASHIRHQGGVVIGSVLLVNATRSGIMTPLPKTIQELKARHGTEIKALFSIEVAALTWSEAQYLLGFRTTDELRNRVIKARQARKSRLFAKGVCE